MSNQVCSHILSLVFPDGFQSLFCSAHPQRNLSSYQLELLNITTGLCDLCSLSTAACQLSFVWQESVATCHGVTTVFYSILCYAALPNLKMCHGFHVLSSYFNLSFQILCQNNFLKLVSILMQTIVVPLLHVASLFCIHIRFVEGGIAYNLM